MLASVPICVSLALLAPLARSQTRYSSLQGGAAGSDEPPRYAANFSLLIPVECGYGFRDGKLCPGYPRFVSSFHPSIRTLHVGSRCVISDNEGTISCTQACPDACHNRTLGGRVEMLAEMMRGIAATADRRIPTTVIVSHPVEFNATSGPPSPKLPEPMDAALSVLRGQGVKVAHYIMTRIPPPLPCCTCCNSYANITEMVDRALSAYPDDSIFYDNGPFAHTESLYVLPQHFS